MEADTEKSDFLEVKGISKSFGCEKVLNDLCFSVPTGKIVAILGPSGCGKSTILRIIAGLIDQDSGEIWKDGKRIDSLPASKRNMGFVFQNYSLFPHMTVWKNIEFGLKIQKTPPEKMKEKINKLLGLIGLEGMESRKPSQLSGGQQQRVALARALAIEPGLLLLDEPFGALDAKIRKKIRRDLKDLQQELGFTAIFVTHDQEEAFEVGDEIAVMNQGKIEQKGLPRILYDRPLTPFVAKFVGNVNVIKLPGSNEEEEEVEVMVRPEDVVLDPEINEHTDEMKFKGARGVLRSYVFLGPCIEVQVELDNNEMLTSVLPKNEFIRKGLRRGDRVKVTITSFRFFSSK